MNISDAIVKKAIGYTLEVREFEIIVKLRVELEI